MHTNGCEYICSAEWERQAGRGTEELTQNEMRDDTGKHEDTEEGQRNDEHVEVAIVALADAVPDPGTVVIEPLDTVVTQAAVGGSRRSEDFTREAEL